MGSVYCVSQSLARRRQRSGLGQPHKDGALHKFCCQGTKTREVTFHFTQTGQVFQSDIVKARVSRSWDNFVYMTGLPTTTTPKKLCRDGTDFSVQSQFRYWSLGSCGSTVPVLVPWFLFLLLNTRVSVQGSQVVVCTFLISVLVRLDFGSISASNQVEPKALVMET